MKTILLALSLAAVLAGCRNVPAPQAARISLFGGTVYTIAKEAKLTLPETVKRLRAMGVEGFDDNYISANIADLSAAGLKPCNFYGFISFLAPDAEQQTDAFVATAVRWGVPRIMCVPDNFTDGGDEAAEFEKILAGLKSLVAKAARQGVTVTVEDYGGVKNPCSHAKYLKRFLDEVPGLCFALDSGNLYYAGRGDCILDMAEYAQARGLVRHVHLKDQTKQDNHVYATLGAGGVPNEKVVKFVHAHGYDGWYTLENPVGPDRLADVARQTDVLRGWLAQ